MTPDPERDAPREGRPPAQVAGIDVGALRALSLVSQLGLSIALPLIAGIWLGQRLDQRWEGHGLGVALGLIIGLCAGGYGAYRSIAGVMGWKK